MVRPQAGKWAPAFCTSSFSRSAPDELTTDLDPLVQAHILSLIGRLVATRGLGVVARLADDVAVMEAGHIVDTAPVAEFFVASRRRERLGAIDRRTACLYHKRHCRRFSRAQAGRLKGNDGSDRCPSLMQAVAVPATVSGESAPKGH